MTLNHPTLLPSMTSQLKALQQLKVFDDGELNAVKNHRKYYEKLLRKPNATCDDMLEYVRYELDFLAVVREKKVDESMVYLKNTVTYSSGNLLNRLFNILVQKYPDRMQLWFLYVTFCRQMKDMTSLLKVVNNMIKVLRNLPVVFQLASRIMREDFKNLSQARAYLMDGVRVHIESQDLYKEAFLVELSICKMKFENSEDAETLMNKPEFLRALEHVYNAARTKIYKVEFFVDLLRSVKGVSYVVRLQNRILDDLRKRFPHEELTWETLADVKYEQLKNPENVPNQRKIVEELIEIYNTAVNEHLNTQLMWSRYVDRMLLIMNDTSTTILPNFKKNCLINALNQAHLRKQLAEKYYLIWCELQKDEKRKLQFLLIAIGVLPTSAPLWIMLLSKRLAIYDDDQVWKHFQECLSRFGKDEEASLPIWKFMLRHYQCHRPEKVDKLFRQAVGEKSGVAAVMKPMYLEWKTMSLGIIHGRELYKELATTKPYSMALHDMMITLENYEIEPNIRSLRRCHCRATEQFGSHDTAVWMKWLHFEYSIGKTENIQQIKDQAVCLLQPALIDEFTADLRLFRIECLTTLKQESAAKGVEKSLCSLSSGKKRPNSATHQGQKNKKLCF